MLLAIPFGLLIGLIVGAVGGGGAILALPVLVYVLDEPVSPASTASLIVVAIAAAVGAGSMARDGQVCWRIALTFSVPAAVGALAGTIANNGVSGAVLILAFVPVMLVAAGATWQRAGSGHADAERPCPEIRASHVLGVGFLVGALTGFFGVGGGFVIVPVLTLMFGVTFRHAVATSLVVISLTGWPPSQATWPRAPAWTYRHGRARRRHSHRCTRRNARWRKASTARTREGVRVRRDHRGRLPAHRHDLPRRTPGELTKAVPAARGSSWWTASIVAPTPAFLMGLGLGGFIDGIVLHQILQWHLHAHRHWDHPMTPVAGLE